MKNSQVKQTKNWEVSHTDELRVVEERISGTTDKVEGVTTSVKVNVKPKNNQ